ncbi:hypothetical protein TNCV_1730721 [Trichonephila clavipes]|nr:hypothetical protein TNCV_1730721 [Trichonephila clavipes]
MVHQLIFRLRCITTTMLHIPEGGLNATDLLVDLHAPRPQFLGFLLLGLPKMACVWETCDYSGGSHDMNLRRFS